MIVDTTIARPLELLSIVIPARDEADCSARVLRSGGRRPAGPEVEVREVVERYFGPTRSARRRS